MSKYKKRKDGRYSTFIDNGKDSLTGERIRIPVYGYTIPELEDNKAAVRDSLNKGTYANDRGLTVASWAKEYVDVYKAGKNKSTINDCNNIIKNHLSCIADIRLQDLKKSDVQKCINNAAGKHDIQRRIRLLINEMLETAIDDGLIYKNVARKVTVPAAPKAQSRALTLDEKKVLPRLDFTLKEKAFVYILWYSGLRPEEARGLQRRDIDLRNQTITVNRVVIYPDKNQPVVSSITKSPSGYRTIPILSPLLPILSDFLKEVDGFYLFTDKSGELMSYTSYRIFWGHIFDKINIALGGTKDHVEKKEKIKGIKVTDITPYVFRHEFATILYYANIDIKEAARIMGHNSTRLILEVYAELDSKKSNSTNKLEQYLSNY